ncbi:MAG: hypothetical protein WC465_04660 [Patescibacteria group bacterium]
MSNYNFWNRWQHKTRIEKIAIQQVIKTRRLVRKAVPAKGLVAIYIKGSFVRREMTPVSDVDMVPIVTANSYEGQVFELNDKDISPVMIIPLSLWELKHNRLFSQTDITPDTRALPDIFLKKLDQYKLIYGRPLDPNKFPIRSDKVLLRSAIQKIKKAYIPAYLSGKIGLATLAKEFFWLVELEQNIQGQKVQHSFSGIMKAVSDKEHLVHKAYYLKNSSRLSKLVKQKFIYQLKKYLQNLEKSS